MTYDDIFLSRKILEKTGFSGVSCGRSDLRQTGVRRQLGLYPGDWLVKNKVFFVAGTTTSCKNQGLDISITLMWSRIQFSF
jgi:hypothetical protein